jgi:hypothetical protein
MEELNKFLTEAMGECWHDWPDRSTPCDKCGQRSSMSNVGMHDNFLTWEGFGKLWTWAIKQEWFDEFSRGHFHSGLSVSDQTIRRYLINPEWFAKAVADFLQKK